MAGFEDKVNLAAERVGAKALLASDDFFAEKENLLKAGRGIFIPDKYTDRGKWMDGWESRRKRGPGHDWCVIRLGLSGIIRGVDIDTNHFLGNHPPHASLEGALVDEDRMPESGDWEEILPKSALERGSQNLFDIASNKRWTHVRLNIFPDGGVARLKVYGDVVPDWENLMRQPEMELSAVGNGGIVLGCNDMFFSDKGNLILPGRGLNMGDGWETRRRREPGHDWVILRLGAMGTLSRLEIDTAHFKGNYPDRASVEGCCAEAVTFEDLVARDDWQPVLPESKLEAHKVHGFSELENRGPFTHVRLNIHPDGGVSRFRVHGRAERPLTEKPR